MSKHTPGPWRANIDRDAVMAADPGRLSSQTVAIVYGDRDDCKPDSRTRANTALIAAAPELLEVLRTIVLETMPSSPQRPHSTDSYLPPHLVAAAQAAISKAEDRA